MKNDQHIKRDSTQPTLLKTRHYQRTLSIFEPTLNLHFTFVCLVPEWSSTVQVRPFLSLFDRHVSLDKHDTEIQSITTNCTRALTLCRRKRKQGSLLAYYFITPNELLSPSITPRKMRYLSLRALEMISYSDNEMNRPPVQVSFSFDYWHEMLSDMWVSNTRRDKYGLWWGSRASVKHSTRLVDFN